MRLRLTRMTFSYGFSILEVILAAAIFMLFATGAAGVIIRGFSTNRLGVEETIGTQFASEGIEAVKSIKNQDYSNLTNSTLGKGVQRNIDGVWEFKPDDTYDTSTHSATDDYIRRIKVQDVYRAGAPPCGDIVSTGGTLDQDSKKITSTVTWNFNSSRPESVDLITYLTAFRKPFSGNGPIMMAYSKTTNVPYYRTWDGSSWSNEGSARTVGGNINYMVLKSSRTREEAVLGTLDSQGNIYVQVWNRCGWGAPTLMAALGTALDEFRSFDIAYEKSGDRAILVYLLSSSNPSYRIWDGSSWSSPTTITTPTTGTVRWIEIAENPITTSNDIAMIMLDANTDVYGMVWNGTSWNNMGDATVWDATASTAVRKAIDVAYEQISGRTMFIWGDSVSTDQYYRIWNGSSLTAATLLDIPAQGDDSHWVKLASRPNSNELMYGVVDAASDLNTRKWSGSAWDTDVEHPEHDPDVENIRSMNFDLVWETHPGNPGKAWLVWGDNTFVSKKQWSGTSWGGATTLTGSDDTSFVRLRADPTSGAIFAGIYESRTSSTDDIWESRLTSGGTTWSAKGILWGGPVSNEPVFFRIDIATP